LKIPSVLTVFLTGILLTGPALAANETGLPTQRQWMVNLVTAMGWSFGLSDTPEDSDYLNILSGRRQMRIEGEKTFQSTDAVSVKRFQTFGDYSSEGWLSGLATSTTANLRFLLPLSGTYRLSVAVRRPGHQVSIAGQTFTADGGQEFTRIELGKIQLSAGELETRIQLPPDGGFDYLELQAPDLAAIAPLAGWELDRPVTLDILAVTAVQVLGLAPLLPPLPEHMTIEAETSRNVVGAQVTDIRHLGEPSGGSWLRAGTIPATVQLDFTPPAPGVYALSIRTASETPITAMLNNRQLLEAPPAAALKDHALGSVFLERGKNTLTLTLAPRGGLDTLQISGQRSEGTDYRRLVGLPTSGTHPTPAQVDRLLALLVTVGAPR